MKGETLPLRAFYRIVEIAMKTIWQLKTFVVGALLAIGLAFAVVAPVAVAACDPAVETCCGGVSTSILECDNNNPSGSLEGTGLWQILIIAINILTAGVGIAAVAGIVYGSFLYTTAGGSPEQVKKAIGVITNVVIGVVAYAGMYIFLNFIIPGGLFT